MPKCTASLKLTLWTVIGSAVCSSCSTPQNDLVSPEHKYAMLKVDSGIALQVGLGRDTIRVGDQAPVELHYTVVNGPQPSRFDNEPGNYEIRLERADGRPVPPVFITSPVTGASINAVLFLPARAVFGQVMDLRCIQDRAGYGSDPSRPPRCLGLYKLDEPGAYRVILRYEGDDLTRQPTRRSTMMDSVTKETSQEQEAILRMADTATLIVETK
jgi:hypothetical protein